MSDENKPSEFVDPGFPTLYANQFMVGSTQFEFSVLAVDRIDEQIASIRTRIVMSPTHAKLLRGALDRQIANHEARFGPIPMPSPKSAPTGSATEPEPQP